MAQLLCIGLLCSSGFISSNLNQNNNRNENFENYEFNNNRRPSTNNNYHNFQQNLPESPCPYFEYVTYSNGETQGRISFQAPQDSNIDLHVELSLRARLSGYYGSIELEKSDTQTSNDIRNGLPLIYKVIFPMQNPIPKVTAIFYNNQKLCSGSPDRGSTVTTIKLDHTLYTGIFSNRQNSWQVPLPYHRATEAPVSYTQPIIIPTEASPGTYKQPFVRPTKAFVQQLESSTSTPIEITTTSTNIRTTCGNSATTIKSRIIGGSETSKGDWPWIVAFYYNVNGNPTFTCGSTLISNRHVISASHCIQNKHEPEQKQPSNALFYIGKHNLISWNEEGYVSSGASKFIMHPDWDVNSERYDADIAIVLLMKTIQFTDDIKPICLPSNGVPTISTTGVVVGWGKSGKNSTTTPEPKVIELPIISESVCLRSHQFMTLITSNRTFCVGNKDGNGPCNGDSGGNFAVNEGGSWILKGIVSVSLLDPETNSCDLNNYVVFTDVDKHMDWITSNIK